MAKYFFLYINKINIYIIYLLKQDVAQYVVLRIPSHVHLCQICIYLNTHYQKITWKGETRYNSPCKSHISNIKSFLPVEAEISVTKVFITANMKNSKSHCKQEVDVW